MAQTHNIANHNKSNKDIYNNLKLKLKLFKG